MGMAKRAEWVRLVERWRRSEQTASQFAEREGLREGTLRHWAWKLRNGRELPAFVEVAAPEVVSGGDLELVLRNELRIRVPAGFDERTLQRLVSMLESP